MIHLDTNYLIYLQAKSSAPASKIANWLQNGQIIAASAIAWTEFLNGPVTSSEIAYALTIMQSQIIVFGQPEAAMAADLFNQTGRRRPSKFDCMIAATAILANAELATVNLSDFRVFQNFGLKLAS